MMQTFILSLLCVLLLSMSKAHAASTYFSMGGAATEGAACASSGAVQLSTSGVLTCNGAVWVLTQSYSNGVYVPDGQYLQLADNNAGAPTAGDCDNDSERGRMTIDITNHLLYICNGAVRAWDHVLLLP